MNTPLTRRDAIYAQIFDDMDALANRLEGIGPHLESLGGIGTTAEALRAAVRNWCCPGRLISLTTPSGCVPIPGWTNCAAS